MTAVEAVWSRELGVPMRRAGTVTIADTESLSDAYPLYYASIVGIAVPTIDSAAITFEVQYEPGGDWFILADGDGVEYEIAASTGGFAFTLTHGGGFYAIKVRSGTNASPVAQSPAVTIGVLARDD